MASKSSPQQGPRQNRLLGKVWLLLSIAGGLALIVFVFYSADRSTSATGWWSAAQTVAAILGLAATLGSLAFLLHRGERHLEPTGREVTRDDPRPPVLFLRSFAAEPLLTVQERVLSRIVELDLGPFVAVGNPGDMLPQLGAARFYERDFATDGRNWKLFVRELLLRASLVIVAPGRSAGLGWEIAQCRELLAPARLVVLVPGDKQTYGEFRGVAALAGLLLPQMTSNELGWGTESDIVGVITFRPDWTASISAFPPTALFENYDAKEQERRMREALSPAIRALQRG